MWNWYDRLPVDKTGTRVLDGEGSFVEMILLLSVCIAYLIGSVPLRNGVFRSEYRSEKNEKIYGILLEMSKGALATVIALILGKWLAASLAAIFVVLGSVYSLFRGFRGEGEAAVGVAIGCLFVLSPLLSLIGVGIFLLLLLITRTFQLSTLIATIVVMIISIFFVQHAFVWVGTICVGILLLMHQKVEWDHIKQQWKSVFKFRK